MIIWICFNVYWSQFIFAISFFIVKLLIYIIVWYLNYAFHFKQQRKWQLLLSEHIHLLLYTILYCQLCINRYKMSFCGPLWSVKSLTRASHILVYINLSCDQNFCTRDFSVPSIMWVCFFLQGTIVSVRCHEGFVCDSTLDTIILQRDLLLLFPPLLR